MNAVPKPIAETPYLEELGRLNGYLHEQKQHFQTDFDRAARYHEDVRRIARSLEDRFTAIEQEIAAIREKHGSADALLEEGRAALRAYDERLRTAELFAARAPLLQAELARKIQEVRNLGRRLQNVEESVNATVARIGGANGFQALQDIPRRIKSEAEKARTDLSRLSDDLSRQLQEQLTAVKDPGIQAIGTAVNRVLDNGQLELELMQSTVNGHVSRLTGDERAEAVVYESRFLDAIEATRREAVALREEMSVQMATCQRMIDDATKTIRNDFQKWIADSVRDVLGPEIAAWHAEVRAGLQANTDRLKEDRISTGWRLHLIEGEQEEQRRSIRRLTRYILPGAAVLIVILLLVVFRQPLMSLLVGGESSSTEQVNVSASVAAPAPTRASGPQEQIAESDEPSLAPAAASESSLAALPTEIPAYSWVVASMTDASEAASLSWRHRTAGRPSAVIATHIDGQARYRVTLGAFESLDAARAARDDLGDWLPEDAWVLERDKGGIATD